MQKHLQKLLLIVAMMVVPWVTQAQTLEEYSFSTGTDTSKWIAVPTTLTSLITPGAGDYGVSSVHNLGFTFPFGEDSYTQFSVNADGNLKLGSSVTGTSNYSSPFSSSNASVNNPKINFFGCDGYCDNNHYVRYLHTADTNGDSLGVVEFCMGTFTSTTRPYLYKWQVHLYHNGKVEVVFGAAPSTAPAVTRQQGLCINSSDGWLINASHSASHFTSGSSTTVASGYWPAEGRYYTFERPNLSCPRPASITVSNVGVDAFDLSWTDTSDATAWLVQLVASDSIWYDNVEYYNLVNFTGLNPNTLYTARVAGLCSNGDTSTWRTIEQRTPCSFINTLPYQNGFEDDPYYSSVTYANAFPSCWTRINDATGTYNYYPYLYNSSTYAHSGNVGMYWYLSTSSDYANNEYAVLPGIDTNVYEISDLTLAFYAKTTSTSYHPAPIVGVMTNPNDASTFTPCDTVVITSDSYENKVVYFRNWTGTGNRIALWAIKNNGVALNQGYVDDIAISLAPTCLPVRDNMSVSNITATTADVAWTPNGTESEWLLRYKASQDQNYDTVWVNGTPTYSLSNLSPNTLYALQVLASCGNGEYAAAWTSLTLFTTNCSDITTLPYAENFESVAGTTSTTENILPDCWNYYNTGTSYTGMPQVYNGSSYAQGGSKSLKFYTFTSSAYSDQYAILPGIDPALYPMNSLQISMGARRISASYNFMLIVGVMTDAGNISTFEPIDTIAPSSTSYINDTVRFANYTGTGKYIALKAPKMSGTNYNEGYVDNIVVDVAPFICNAPTNVTASNVQQTSATITWTAANGESDWVLQYREPSGSWSSDINVTGTPSHNLTGLTASTQYEVRVQAVCDNTHSSDWSATATFTTQSSVTPPTVTTNDATNIGETTATLNGAVTAGSETITAQGFEWKATVGGSYTAVNVTGATMSHDLTGLTAGTSYTFRAFATTASGTTYGVEKTFTTQSSTVTPPTVTTNDATSITQTSATLNGAMTAGSEAITAQGFEWKATVGGTYTVVNATGATMSYYLTGLTPNTSYTFKAFATTASGTTYGEEKTFTTEPVGIENHEMNNVVVYPNPTSGVVQIKNEEWRMESVEVYDAYGKLLNTMIVNDHTVTLDLSGYATGTYFVRVTTERGVVTKRVVKN